MRSMPTAQFNCVPGCKAESPTVVVPLRTGLLGNAETDAPDGWTCSRILTRDVDVEAYHHVECTEVALADLMAEAVGEFRDGAYERAEKENA